MALTVTLVRAENTPLGKQAIVDVQFDSSYPTGGETLDLTAASGGSFTAVTAVTVAEGPYGSAGGVIAPEVCTKINYAYAASRAPATGKLMAYEFSAADATGVWQEVANTSDLSTVYARLHVLGR